MYVPIPIRGGTTALNVATVDPRLIGKENFELLEHRTFLGCHDLDLLGSPRWSILGQAWVEKSPPWLSPSQVILNSLHGRGYWAALLISHCTRLQAPPPYARLVFDSAHQPNVLLFTAMLKFYTNLDAHGDVINLFDEMLKCGVKPDAFVYPIVVKSAGYAQNGFAEEAISLFSEMVSAGVHPDKTTWVAVISSCSSRGDPCVAESLLKLLDEKCIRLNVFVLTALLDMHAKCGNLACPVDIKQKIGSGRPRLACGPVITMHGLRIIYDAVSSGDATEQQHPRSQALLVDKLLSHLIRGLT
ncbi:hypothetical protein RJ639_035227 [Escallonia herrerae]|uniref:Pentatricopeptide repeat-containing protein n=1 Tax=Escallonia herrerae TaxID=1293975 RepID=A0AA89BGQ4_9ASTE|nr:hypothetical protein RJ639_035227 [Escallonia herrerae]